MTESLLQARALGCERDDRLLFEQLSFEIASGTLTRIEGANGAGKTTLLRLLCGLAPLQEGALYWCGEPLEKVREEFYGDLLYIGHRTGVKALLSPVENLKAFFKPRHGVALDQIMNALAQVGLTGYEDVACRNLSAGQQRRVALARLLLSPERLWVLDEAFTAIDRQGVMMLEGLLRARADAGGAVVVTTHHELSVRVDQRIVLSPTQTRVLAEECAV